MPSSPTVETDSKEEAQRLFSTHLGACEIRTRPDAVFGMEFSHVDFERTSLFRWHTTSDVEVVSSFDRHVICVCIEGRIAFEQSGEALLVEGMRAAIVPPWERRLMRWSAGTTLIGVTISESTFRRETLSMLQGAFTLRLGAARSFDVSVNPGKTFLDILEMLQADLAGVQSSRNNKSIRLLFDRLIVYSLLRVVEDDVKQPARETNRSLAPRHIKRAEEYIKVHLADHLDNALLASVAEVSPRSLYRGFVHFRGVTPARYIQDLRLDEAHKLLTDRGATSDIKVIASRAGFRSYASFWRSYVRKYGTTPSKARPPRRSADVEGAPTPEGDS